MKLISLKNCLITALIMMLLVVPFAFSAETIKTLTFEWESDNAPGAVIVWRMEWGVTAGGPYAQLADIPYADAESGVYNSPVQATVTGQPGTHETRYFILKACGDVAQEDGSTVFECSDPSNEVSYAFWIAATGFSAPVQFRIKEE